MSVKQLVKQVGTDIINAVRAPQDKAISGEFFEEMRVTEGHGDSYTRRRLFDGRSEYAYTPRAELTLHYLTGDPNNAVSSYQDRDGCIETRLRLGIMDNNNPITRMYAMGSKNDDIRELVIVTPPRTAENPHPQPLIQKFRDADRRQGDIELVPLEGIVKKGLIHALGEHRRVPRPGESPMWRIHNMPDMEAIIALDPMKKVHDKYRQLLRTMDREHVPAGDSIRKIMTAAIAPGDHVQGPKDVTAEPQKRIEK